MGIPTKALIKIKDGAIAAIKGMTPKKKQLIEERAALVRKLNWGEDPAGQMAAYESRKLGAYTPGPGSMDQKHLQRQLAQGETELDRIKLKAEYYRKQSQPVPDDLKRKYWELDDQMKGWRFDLDNPHYQEPLPGGVNETPGKMETPVTHRDPIGERQAKIDLELAQAKARRNKSGVAVGTTGIAALSTSSEDVEAAPINFVMKRAAKLAKDAERAELIAKREFIDQQMSLMQQSQKGTKQFLDFETKRFPGLPDMVNDKQMEWLNRDWDNEALFKQLSDRFEMPEHFKKDDLATYVDSFATAMKRQDNYSSLEAQRAEIEDIIKKLSAALGVPPAAVIHELSTPTGHVDASILPGQASEPTNERQRIEDEYGLGTSDMLDRYMGKSQPYQHTDSYGQAGVTPADWQDIPAKPHPDWPMPTDDKWDQVGNRLLAAREGIAAIPGDWADIGGFLSYSPLLGAMGTEMADQPVPKALFNAGERAREQYMSNPQYEARNWDEGVAHWGSRIGLDPLTWVGTGATKHGPKLPKLTPAKPRVNPGALLDPSRRKFMQDTGATAAVGGIAGLTGLKYIMNTAPEAVAKATTVMDAIPFSTPGMKAAETNITKLFPALKHYMLGKHYEVLGASGKTPGGLKINSARDMYYGDLNHGRRMNLEARKEMDEIVPGSGDYADELVEYLDDNPLLKQQYDHYENVDMLKYEIQNDIEEGGKEALEAWKKMGAIEIDDMKKLKWHMKDVPPEKFKKIMNKAGYEIDHKWDQITNFAVNRKEYESAIREARGKARKTLLKENNIEAMKKNPYLRKYSMPNDAPG